MTLQKLFLTLKGSSTSGNYGHSGRPGKRGGSVPGGYSITLRNSLSSENEMNFHHEMGHAAYQNSRTKSEWSKAYRQNPNFDRHTNYSKNLMRKVMPNLI